MEVVNHELSDLVIIIISPFFPDFVSESTIAKTQYVLKSHGSLRLRRFEQHPNIRFEMLENGKTVL